MLHLLKRYLKVQIRHRKVHNFAYKGLLQTCRQHFITRPVMPKDKTSPRQVRAMSQEVSKRLALRKVASVIKTTNTKGCWLPVSISKNNDGYAQLKFIPDLLSPGATGKANQRTYLLHKLSMLAYDISMPSNGKEQASHLCDTRECFNPQHLFTESIVTNNSRKGCPGDLVCPKGCDGLVYECPHVPKCVRVISKH